MSSYASLIWRILPLRQLSKDFEVRVASHSRTRAAESLVFVPVRLAKVPKVIRQASTRVAPVQMMKQVHIALAPTATVARLPVLEQQPLWLGETVHLAPGFRPPEDAVDTAVELGNVTFVGSIARVPRARSG